MVVVARTKELGATYNVVGVEVMSVCLFNILEEIWILSVLALYDSSLSIYTKFFIKNKNIEVWNPVRQRLLSLQLEYLQFSNKDLIC